MPKGGRDSGFERRSPFTAHYRRVQGEGPVPCRIALVGERPGEHEARSGRPFVGPAGQLLDTLLTAANLDRKHIYITNLVKDFRDYEKPTQEDIERELPELLEELDRVNPEIVGLLGTFAVEALLHRTRADMERTHGVPERNGDGRIYVPVYHPAAGLYNADVMSNVLDDFLRLGQLADGEIQVREDEWLGRENYEQWTEARPLIVKLDCAIDTEGTRERPWCATVSTGYGTAWMVKSQKLQVESKTVYLHNSLHDLGVLRTLGINLGESQFRDTMVLAYHLCVEPQGLKPLAYRHCGALQDDYLELVAEPSIEKALEFMLTVNAQDWAAPEPYMVTEKGLPKIKKPQGVNRLVDRALGDLAADKRDKDGNPVDLRKRWHSWDDTVKAAVVAELGEMPVATLDDVEPERAMRYACRDADVTLRIAPVLEQRIRDMELTEAVALDHSIIPMVDRMQQVGIKLAPVSFWDDIEAQCDAQMGRAKYQVYKMTGAEINPDSGDQVAELLYGQLGLHPPKMTDSGARGAVDGLALESLLAEAPVVEPIMDYKEASKIKSTYVRPMRKLCQQGDGRAYSTVRLTRTTTGRLSMADPPLHQIPIMTELGRQIRAGFVAPEGRILGDWDLDQIEMRIMAHESRDEELCRLFIEGQDIHSQTAAKIFSVPLHDIAGKKDVRRTVAKHAGFGIINGITEHGLLNYLILNRCKRPDGESWTLDDCVMLLNGWFDVYPGVRKFQQERVREAEETGLSRESISGRIIYLPAVWHPTNKVMRESAGRMSYVMHTQGGAAALIKKTMKVIWDTVCKVKELAVEPLLWVHDELLFECPDDYRIQEIDERVNHALSTTVKLRVPVKASGGFAYNWLEAH